MVQQAASNRFQFGDSRHAPIESATPVGASLARVRLSGPSGQRAMKLDKNAAYRIRTNKGFSLGRIAADLGIDKSAVSQWFTGKRGISLENAVKLAGMLSCTIGQLIGKEPYEPPAPPSADEEDVLVKIEEKVDDWYKGKGDIIMEAFRLIVESGGAIRLTRNREGCVEITIRLTHEQAARLEKAFADGKLDHLKVIALRRLTEGEKTEVEATIPDDSSAPKPKRSKASKKKSRNRSLPQN